MALVKCNECGKEISDKANQCPNCGDPTFTNVIIKEPTQKGFWSAGRLSIGTISLVLSVIVLFQSCAVGLANTISENGSTSGANGFGFTIFIIVAGVVGVITRNSKGKAGSVIATVFYWLASITTIDTGETFGDLPIWGFISFIFGIIFLICAVKTKKEQLQGISSRATMNYFNR